MYPKPLLHTYLFFGILTPAWRNCGQILFASLQQEQSKLAFDYCLCADSKALKVNANRSRLLCSFLQIVFEKDNHCKQTQKFKINQNSWESQDKKWRWKCEWLILKCTESILGQKSALDWHDCCHLEVKDCQLSKASVVALYISTLVMHCCTRSAMFEVAGLFYMLELFSAI